jgi:hypothetical protein
MTFDFSPSITASMQESAWWQCYQTTFLFRRWLRVQTNKCLPIASFITSTTKTLAQRRNTWCVSLWLTPITPKDEAEKATFNCSTHNDGDHIMGATKLVHDDIKLNVTQNYRFSKTTRPLRWMPLSQVAWSYTMGSSFTLKMCNSLKT